MTNKVYRPWEHPRDDRIHSPIGIEQLKNEVAYGLNKLYKGIAQSMWEYDFNSEEFSDCQVMSRNTVPEIFLGGNGKCVAFRTGSQIHFLPVVFDGVNGINMYGKMASWHPMPVGYDNPLEKNDTFEEIVKMRLDDTNSVIWCNDRFGTGDNAFIEKMVDLLVDNILSANQLQLLASMPFVFNVSDDNVLTAKNYFLSVCQHKPAIFMNSNGEKTVPVVENFNMKIDPSLFEVFDRFECDLLSYLGYPCIPVTKRAQQSVSEVQSNSDKVEVRRREKLRMRERACERMKAVFGVEIKVRSVIDEMMEAQRMNRMEEQKEIKGVDSDV